MAASPAVRRRAPLLPLAVLAFLCAPGLAQAPAVALARELAAALAPAQDDTEAHAEALLRAALASPRSPVAALLADEASQRVQWIADLSTIEALLQQAAGAEPMHGLLALELRELRAALAVRRGEAPPADRFAGWATTVDVIGPFGDSGRHHLDVPFAPDVRFPAAGETLRGRYGPVAVRTLVRDAQRRGFELQQKRAHADGCHFACWRVVAEAAAEGYLEIDYRGAFRAFVDGVEIGRADPYLAPTPRLHRLALRLPAGGHELVVKTGDDSSAPLSLRLCDAAGGPLALVNEAPQGTPPAAERGGPSAAGPFRDAGTVLLATAEEPTTAAKDAETLRAVAAYDASRRGDPATALRLLRAFEATPTSDPALVLVLADLWLRANDVPDEIRTAKARALEAEATKALSESHYKAIVARVRRFEDQDQREQALRLLDAEIEAGRAGAAIFAMAHGVARALHFDAELPRILRRWQAACPGDSRPCVMLADRHSELGDPRTALQWIDAARALRPADENLLSRAVLLALDLGDVEGAVRRLDAADRQPTPGAEGIGRLGLRLAIAQSRGDAEAARAVHAAIAAHPAADARVHRQALQKWIAVGDDVAALASIERSLALDPDQRDLRLYRERLGGPSAEGADFARFRRDADAAVAAFRPGEQERAASTSLLIDQRIVEVLPDGSALVEVHELRSINDLQGVDALRTAEAPARSDELLALRTIGKDGKSYVPSRVEGGFSMPRLEPGAFVEWRFRDHVQAPGADAFRIEDFLFASQGEPLSVTEWIVVQPTGSRGELRTRNLDVAAQTEPLDDGRTVTVLRRTDVPRIPQESSQPPSESLIPMAGIGEDASEWPELRGTRHGWLWRTRTTPPVADAAAELLGSVEGDRQKLERAYAHCQTEIADGEGSDATEILLRKKGNRFVLCLALLRAAGVPLEIAACEPALPILQGNGEPLFASGDRCGLPAALVRPRDGQPVWLFYDSPRHWPLGDVPAFRGGALAYVVHADHAEQTRLPVADGAAQDFALDGTCQVGDDGARLRASVSLLGHTGFSYAEQIRRIPADRQKLVARQFAQQFLEGWRMRSAEFVDLVPPGKPLAFAVEVTGPAPQQDGEGRWLVPMPLVPMSLRENFGDREERTLPLQVQTDMRSVNRVRLEPPENRTFGELPAPLLVSFGPLDYQLSFAREGEAVVVERRIRMHPAVLPASMYGDWIRWLAVVDRAEEQRLSLVARTSQAK